MYQQPKSATTAGLLGIFLGSVGAHNWYLGEKSKGIAHVCMMSGGILVNILASLILPNIFSMTMLLQTAWLFTILTGIAGLAMSASAIWGLVEGIMILTQGDAGLAAKGYPVAMPANGMPVNNYYGQPMGGMNSGMNTSMNNMGPQANSVTNNMNSQGVNSQMNNVGVANYNNMPTNGNVNNASGMNNGPSVGFGATNNPQSSMNNGSGQVGNAVDNNDASSSNNGNQL